MDTQNNNSKILDKKIDKTKNFGVLDWIILVVVIFMLPGSIMLFIGDIFSGSTTIVAVVADIVWFTLSVWGLKVKLRKFKILKTPKSYKIVLIVSYAVAIIVLGSAFLSIFSALRHASPSIDNIKQTKKVDIDFKKLSSVEVVSKINSLSSDDQFFAYQQHSALVREMQKVWLENLEGKGIFGAFKKTLPILISNGWTDESARDSLSWLMAKSIIILDRDPSSWCKSGDCMPKSEEEIKVILREDKSLTEEVINGIFQELKIDNS